MASPGLSGNTSSLGRRGLSLSGSEHLSGTKEVTAPHAPQRQPALPERDPSPSGTLSRGRLAACPRHPPRAQAGATRVISRSLAWAVSTCDRCSWVSRR
jgi:hypothetical protein